MEKKNVNNEMKSDDNKETLIVTSHEDEIEKIYMARKYGYVAS